MDGGRFWLVLAGGLIIVVTLAFFAFSFEGSTVSDFEADPEAEAPAPVSATIEARTPALGSAPTLNRTEQFCLDMGYAEIPCGGAVKALCDDLGAGDPACELARESYCNVVAPTTPICERP
ncbi:MAG: hypothetical protein WEB00_15360 [Dehalococcoidia bacterium]